MKITATEAKNHLGKVLEESQHKTVFIEKAGRRHSVVISNQRYEQLLKAEAGESMAQRKRRFNEQYKDWIAAQNQHFEANGLWNDELRIW
ncbi:MAG TPA: type II toxin-antitoxin system prevent-host-death family antitoxin [Rhizobacter sp.]|nr:type II toxin-antitoxin system prevent-host-death family antitoxin [Rhizobacter sp.]